MSEVGRDVEAGRYEEAAYCRGMETGESSTIFSVVLLEGSQ